MKFLDEDNEQEVESSSQTTNEDHSYAITLSSPTLSSFSVSPSLSPSSSHSSSSSSSSQPSKRRRRRPLLTFKEELQKRRRKIANESAADRERRLQLKRKASRALKEKRKKASIEKEETSVPLMPEIQKLEVTEECSVTTTIERIYEEQEKVLTEKKKQVVPNLSSFCHHRRTRSMTAAFNSFESL